MLESYMRRYHDAIILRNEESLLQAMGCKWCTSCGVMHSKQTCKNHRNPQINAQTIGFTVNPECLGLQLFCSRGSDLELGGWGGGRQISSQKWIREEQKNMIHASHTRIHHISMQQMATVAFLRGPMIDTDLFYMRAKPEEQAFSEKRKEKIRRND